MSVTSSRIANIPTELSDQWNGAEREACERLISARQTCLAAAADPEADIDKAARADSEAEEILQELVQEFNVTPEMLTAAEPEAELDPFEQAEPPPKRRRKPAAVAGVPDPDPEAEAVGDPGDPRVDEDQEQLTLPGAGKPGSRLSRKVMLEGKFIGKGVRLTHEITDPDQTFRVMAICRFDHNVESPQRSGSGSEATTESVLKTQHFRVMRFEIQEDVEHVINLLDALSPEDIAAVRDALDER